MTTEYQTQLDNHEERLTAVEKRQDAQGSKLDEISRDIAAVRAEGNARAITATHSMDQVRGDIRELTRQIAEHTGAQKRQNELDAAKTRRWQRISIVLGIFLTVLFGVGSMLLSWQEVASYLWVDILHLKEPWPTT